MMTDEERKASRKATLRKYRQSKKNYENQLRYRKKNMELFCEHSRKSYHKDIELSRDKNRKKYLLNRESILAQGAKYAKDNRVKRLAKDSVNNAIRSGKITKKPCWCGSSDVEGHHPDYSKPLDVIWLCVKHHKEIHRKYRKKELI